MLLLEVPAEAYARVREVVDPWLDAALDYGFGEYCLADVAERIAGKQWQLWLFSDATGPRAAAVTRIVPYPQRTVCEVLLLGSDAPVEDIAPLFCEFHRWAKNQGCDCVKVHGRRGWKKVLPTYSEQYTVLVNDLRDCDDAPEL